MNHKRTSEQSKTQNTVEQFFKESFEDIHVPPQLKEDTLRKMRDKQAELDSRKIIPFYKHAARTYRLSALAAVFALLIFGTVFFSSPKVKISTILTDGLVSDYGAMHRVAESVQVKEAETDGFPFRYEKNLRGFELAELHAYEIFNAGGTRLDTVFELTYVKREKMMTLVLSEKQALAPPALYTTQTQNLSGTPVFLGQDAQSKAYYAAWSASKYTVVAQIENCSKTMTLELLKAALNMMEAQ